MYQSLVRSLLEAASKCICRRAFKYRRTDEKHNRDAIKAIYRPRWVGEIGTDKIPIPLQKCRYTNCWHLYDLAVDSVKVWDLNRDTSLFNAAVSSVLACGSGKRQKLPEMCGSNKWTDPIKPTCLMEPWNIIGHRPGKILANTRKLYVADNKYSCLRQTIIKAFLLVPLLIDEIAVTLSERI